MIKKARRRAYQIWLRYVHERSPVDMLVVGFGGCLGGWILTHVQKEKGNL